MKKILMIFGTRPEAIKMAPLYHQLKQNIDFETQLCVTAQHREMLDQVLSIFQMSPDFDLDIMRETSSMHDALSLMIRTLPKVYNSVKPNLVLVHGDTASTLGASLAAFYSNIKKY